MKAQLPILALATLTLSACSLGGKAPDLLLTLTPEQAVPVQGGTTSSAENAITVVRPSVPQALSTTRIPVTNGQSLAYLKDAFWADTPDQLFRRLLSETIGARTGRTVLDPLQFNFNPGNRLTGQLQAFGLDAQRMEAVVTYDAALARGAELVTTRRFEARVPVSAADRNAVAPALNQAANQVAAQVADWVGR
jgi:cholesterol transport system auxiliary component